MSGSCFLCGLVGWLSVFTITFASEPVSQPATTRPASALPDRARLAEILGCTHASGTYNFTSKDFLNEGADVILEAGFKTIKLYLHHPQKHYGFNSSWPERFPDLVSIARHDYYRQVFSKPFRTFILTVLAPGSWRGGYSDEDRAEDVRQCHDLTAYLLKTYRGTGKTFILQNWEGDWAVRGNFDAKSDPSDERLERMIRWFNARQEGVNQARREAGPTDVKVYHAAEVNLVRIAMEGRKSVTNDVLPHTRCDLYSYSAYDTINLARTDYEKGRRAFRDALDYIAVRAPDSPDFGDKNVYVGEFGCPEVYHPKTDPHATTARSLQVLRMTVETAAEWGCPYVVYWQVYDNEAHVKDQRPTNDQVRGFYLVKPDGTRAPACDYFLSLLKPAASRPW